MRNLKLNIFTFIIGLLALIALISLLLLSLYNHPKKVVTNLFVDRSRSNVENEQKRLISQETCKYVVSNQEDIDELAVIEFDSDADSSQEILTNSDSNSREYFISSVCKILATKAPKYSVPGTDIMPAFERYIKIINARKPQNTKQDNQHNKNTYISVFSIDALEGATYDSGNTKTEKFKTSVKNFLKSDNFILIFVGDDTDREKLVRFLKDIKDSYPSNIYIEDVDKKKIKKRILDLYSKLRT